MPSEHPVADAHLLRLTLARRYRDLAGQLIMSAKWLEDASVAELAAMRRPIPYRHRLARDLEDALDEALTAL